MLKIAAPPPRQNPNANWCPTGDQKNPTKIEESNRRASQFHCEFKRIRTRVDDGIDRQNRFNNNFAHLIMLSNNTEVIRWLWPKTMAKMHGVHHTPVSTRGISHRQHKQHSIEPTISTTKATTATAPTVAVATATETTTTSTTTNTNCNLFSERQRKQSRDNLLNIDFYKFILLIWLVINQNVSVVLSADNNNNFSTNYFELHAINSNRFENNAMANASANRIGVSDVRRSGDDAGPMYTKHQIISDDDIEQENHFTSTWAVHVPGGKHEADSVAAEHGFDNLGEVSTVLLPIYSRCV